MDSWLAGDASVTRAVAVAVVYLALAATGLTSSLLRIVTVVAAGTLLVDPLTVVDVGAWLSYGATVGIVVCAPRIVEARPAVAHPNRRTRRRVGPVLSRI